MEKQEFKISINAPREKVWEVLWNDTTYPAWTAVFSEGSHAVTDWKTRRVVRAEVRRPGGARRRQ